MTRFFLAVCIVVGAALLAIAVPVVVLVVSFARTAPIPEGREIAPGVVTIKEGMVEAFMVDTGDGKVALVDAGMDPAAKPIIAELARRGLTPDAVTAILLTHGHRDHLGGCAAFPKAPVRVLEADVALAEGRTGSRSPMGWMSGVKPTGLKVGRVLRDGETVRLGKASFHVFAIPGHTPGSAALLVRGVLIMGDSADSLKDGKMSGAKWMFSEDVAGNRASLKALAKRLRPGEVKVLAFSHSGPLEGLQPLLDFAATTLASSGFASNQVASTGVSSTQ